MPLHQASLLDPSSHSQALLDLLDLHITRSVIDYLVDSVAETVDFATGHPSSSRGRSRARDTATSKFNAFATKVLQNAEVKMPVVLVTLVYINRAKPHLRIAMEEWALERVFLGALILASKYLNDSSLKNVHWALCTGVFGRRDVGRIEREFLDVLDFELGVQEGDLLLHHASLMPIPPRRHHRSSTHTHPDIYASDTDVPTLCSSPASSVDSDSPRTPATTLFSPHSHTHRKSMASFSGPSHDSPSTMQLLKSFPTPHKSASHPAPPAPSYSSAPYSSRQPFHSHSEPPHLLVPASASTAVWI